MNASEFVEYWKKEKNDTLELYTSSKVETDVSATIEKMKLSLEERKLMTSVIDGVLTDTYFSLLLGLDGSGSIGGMQENFKLLDESGNLISGFGEIETEAWKQFHDE